LYLKPVLDFPSLPSQKNGSIRQRKCQGREDRSLGNTDDMGLLALVAVSCFAPDNQCTILMIAMVLFRSVVLVETLV